MFSLYSFNTHALFMFLEVFCPVPVTGFLLFSSCTSSAPRIFLSHFSSCIHNLCKNLQVRLTLFLTILPSTSLFPLHSSSTALFLRLNKGASGFSHQMCSPTHEQCWDRHGMGCSSAEHCTGKVIRRGVSVCAGRCWLMHTPSALKPEAWLLTCVVFTGQSHC